MSESILIYTGLSWDVRRDNVSLRLREEKVMWQCSEVIAYNSTPLFKACIRSGEEAIVPNTVIWKVQGLDRRSCRWVDVGSSVRVSDIPSDGVVSVTLSREHTKFVNGLSDQRRLVVNFYYGEAQFQADSVEFELTELPVVQPSGGDAGEFADFRAEDAVLDVMELSAYVRSGGSFVEERAVLQSVYVKANHPITLSGVHVRAVGGGEESHDFGVASFLGDSSYSVRLLFPAVSSFEGSVSVTSQVTRETAVVEFSQGAGASAVVGKAVVGSAVAGAS